MCVYPNINQFTHQPVPRWPVEWGLQPSQSTELPISCRGTPSLGWDQTYLSCLSITQYSSRLNLISKHVTLPKGGHQSGLWSCVLSAPGKNVISCLDLYEDQSVPPSLGGLQTAERRVQERVWADVREKTEETRERFQLSQGRTNGSWERTPWGGGKRNKVLKGSGTLQRHGCCSFKHSQIKPLTWY